MLLLALTLSTSTRGAMMIYLLFFLIPVGALLVWAARVDRKRRRDNSVHDINAARLTARRDAQRKATEWTAGM